MQWVLLCHHNPWLFGRLLLMEARSWIDVTSTRLNKEALSLGQKVLKGRVRVAGPCRALLSCWASSTKQVLDKREVRYPHTAAAQRWGQVSEYWFETAVVDDVTELLIMTVHVSDYSIWHCPTEEVHWRHRTAVHWQRYMQQVTE